MSSGHDPFGALDTAAASGPRAVFAVLHDELAAARRWHALFDARIVEARLALGLPPTGPLPTLTGETRDRLDELSIAACLEAGWPLLAEGHVAAAWMYLRATADESQLAGRLESLVERRGVATGRDEETVRLREEIIGIAVWEAAAPALGIGLVLAAQGTCNAITAYEQALSRLPAVRQQPAAAILVAHLHREVAANLAADLGRRGVTLPAAAEPSIPELLAAGGGLADDPAVHVDVSHLQSALRIARVCADLPTLRRAWELATYAGRLPAEARYPGEAPFTDVAGGSRLYFGAQLGLDVEEAVAFFRRQALEADPAESGSLPTDVLVVLLTRLGRPAEALHAALVRGVDGAAPSTMQAAGVLPSLVELAAACGGWEILRRACRDRGDLVTYAATLVAKDHQIPNPHPEPTRAQSRQGLVS